VTATSSLFEPHGGGGHITFGITVPLPSGDQPLDLAPYEALGIESFWVGGHLASARPTPEAMTSLAHVAGLTRSAIIGTSIVLLPLYPPLLLAKQAAEVDRFSGGRVVLGVGVGGEYPKEFAAVQVPREERGARADESIAVLRRLWTGDAIEHHGRFFPMEGVKIHPRPSQPEGPPIVVAGRQERAMHRAATLGDGWMPYLYSPRRYRASVEAVRVAAASASRDLSQFAWMLWIVVSIDHDGERALREAASRQPGGPNADAAALAQRIAVAGTPDTVVSRLCEYVDAGVRHFIFAISPQNPLGQTRLLVEQVMPAVRAHRSDQVSGPGTWQPE
jgi:probable F420-dependent oxidoreductase